MTFRLAPLAWCLIAAGQALWPVPARAQCRLCTGPQAEPTSGEARAPVALSVEAALDFDRVILMSAGAGTATLSPDGSRQVSGSVAALGARAMVGLVRVRGEPGRSVRIGLPRRIELRSLAGGQLVIEDVASDVASVAQLDPSGAITFRFGGRLHVSGDAEGEYRGDVPIMVEYL